MVVVVDQPGLGVSEGHDLVNICRAVFSNPNLNIVYIGHTIISSLLLQKDL